MAKPAELLVVATATRNEALEFAARTLKNLEFLEKAQQKGADVHVVTNLANSLLGLIVFPVEKNFVRFMLKQKLADLTSRGWPSWSFYIGSSETLGDLVYHLRNAVAHGRITFSTDSRNPSQVCIEAADVTPATKDIYRRASIPATSLKNFCKLYIKLLDDVIG